MKDLEKKLLELEIPTLESDPFEHELRRNLVNRFFNKERNYKRNFRLSLGFAALLAVFGFWTIINPQVALELNEIAFQTEEIPVRESLLSETADDEISSYALALDKYNELMDNMKTTSIYNPRLSGKLNPESFEEDRAYLIRKYTSQTEGSVMIVSEINQKPNKSARKISY
jgi:hypothetical protein